MMNKQRNTSVQIWWFSLCYIIAPPGNLRVIQHGIFGGLFFGPRIILGIVGRVRDFLGFDFCLHSIIPVILSPEYPPGLFSRGYI